MTLVRWCWIAVAVALTGCTARPAAPVAPSGQKITLGAQTLTAGGADTVRFGHMHSGEIAVLPLVFENKSAQPLVILGYDRTCGCTTLEYENQPLKPNEQRAARLTFDARGAHGWQLKLVKIRLAGVSEPHKLYIEAEVE